MLQLPLVAALLACDGGSDKDEGAPPAAEPDWLTPTEHLARISITLRGVRPSPEEVAAVLEDPGAIGGLVEGWLATPEFGRTIKDMHSEFYRVRVDTAVQYPPLGPIAGISVAEVHDSTADEPLRLVEDIVMNDLPYTEVVTADWIIADRTLALMFGLPFDPDGPDYQRTWWTDGRPAAGVITSSEFYHRFPSNGNNFHRGRAAVVADIFLCDDIAIRDTQLTVESAPPSTQVDQVVDTLTVAGCAGCHSALEPLASFFWGFRPVVPPGPLDKFMLHDCEVPSFDDRTDLPPGAGYATDLCYPLRMYTPADESLREDLGLPEPALYGAHGDDIADLGRLIADDPRFATCTAKRFTSWFTQVGLEGVDPGMATVLGEQFALSGFNARELVRQIVLSDLFRARNGVDPADVGVGLLTVRPEQYASQIKQLTGFTWVGDHFGAECAEAYNCWGEVDLARTDLYGFRAMSGGIDGIQQTLPVHTPTPTRQLVMDRFAAEASGFVVDHDFAVPAEERTLLRVGEPGDVDESRVRDQIVDLMLRILTVVVAADDPAVDEVHGLYEAALTDAGNDPKAAWKLVVLALLTDPQMVVF